MNTVPREHLENTHKASLGTGSMASGGPGGEGKGGCALAKHLQETGKSYLECRMSLKSILVFLLA